VKPSEELSAIQLRKDDHLNITLQHPSHSLETSWLEHITLIHNAFPPINFKEIETSTTFLGRSIAAPLILGALTGGTPKGQEINEQIATLAEQFQIPMMLGSQRIALEHPQTIETFSIARKKAPTALLIANIGIAQLTTLQTVEDLEKLVQVIEADAIAVHLNPLQEVIQPRGDTDFKNYLPALLAVRDLARQLHIPLIVKETGAGLSREVVQMLIDHGISILDVAGRGGTSFSMIEHYRATQMQDIVRSTAGETFRNWGVPTAASIIEARSISPPSMQIIGSGGIRTGLDIAKALTIGADLCAIAKPLLDHGSTLQTYIETIIYELKVAMFLTGQKTPLDLRQNSFIVQSPLKDWLEQRNIPIPAKLPR
jgi:isopentenyl-diphosphate delta-isomerase